MTRSLLLSLMLLLLSFGCRSGNPDEEKALNVAVVPEGFDVKTLEDLKCPTNDAKLRLATRRELNKINDRIANFQVRTFDGDLFTEIQPALLLRADGKVAHRFNGSKPSIKLGNALLLDVKKK